MEYKDKIRAFIVSNLTVFDDDVSLSDGDNIFQLGYVNSLFAMKLLNFVEKEFEITIYNEEMDVKNFSSVDNIFRLVQQKKATAPINE